MISRFWRDAEERDGIRQFHKRYWRRIKKKHDHELQNIPGFIEGLRQLLEIQGYCLEDVSVMFGVSRERVRQWAKKFDIKPATAGTRGSFMRVWDEDLSRFRLLDATDDYRELIAQRERRKRNREKRREYDQRKIRVAASARRFLREHGRPPYLAELCQYDLALRQKPDTSTRNSWIGRLATAFGIDRQDASWFSKTSDRLYRYAGLDRPDGRHWTGTATPRALDDAEAHRVRAEYRAGGITQRELAERYDVRQSTIWRCVNYKGAYSNGKQ